MENDNTKFFSELERSFEAYLREQGFSANSIVAQPSFSAITQGHGYKPDFAIVDSESKEVLAVVEVKGASGYQSEAGKAKVKQLSEALADKSIEFFLVTPSTGSEPKQPFDIFKIAEDGTPKVVPLSSFPTFDGLAANKIATERDKIEVGIAGTTGKLKITCNLLAVFLLSVVAADFVLKFHHIILLTTERLTAMGIASALFIIPYAAKFKGFGIEYEKYNDLKKE